MDSSELGRQGTRVLVFEGVLAVEAARSVHPRVSGVEVISEESALHGGHCGDVSGDPNPPGAVRVHLAEDWDAAGVESEGVVKHGARTLGDEGV